MEEERDRLSCRLATLTGIRTLPSIGSWILVSVDDPSDLAHKVNRRLDWGTVSVPRNVAGAVRLRVRDRKRNEELFQTLRELLAARSLQALRRRYEYPSSQARTAAN